MSENKKILLISYHFPPLGMGGVTRPYYLYKYLKESGFDIKVLTVKNILYPQYDYSIPAKTEEPDIFRSGSFDPLRLMYLLGRRKANYSSGALSLAGRLYYPDARRGWNLFAYIKAKKIIKQNDIRLVITSSPPPSSHLIGLKLKKKLGLRWIADFRDFWFSRPIEKIYQSQGQRRYALSLRGKIINSADEIICVNKSIKKYLGRGEVIYNGTDITLSNCWRKETKDRADIFTIGILGTINYLSPIAPLFKAVDKLIKSNPEIKEKIRIVHVGRYDNKAMLPLPDSLNLKSNVVLKGYLPKAEAIKSLADSDMLYFSVASFGPYFILPSRIFDYICSGRPILALAPPDSDVERLLNNYHAGQLYTEDQIDKIAEFILKLYNNPEMYDKSKKTDMEYLKKYSNQFMAEQYAAVIERVLA
jgi:glycosyltransferase involved in cell wall biosynthesis